ncbi:hypothetical protein [Arenibacter lacus]|uniref:hypothetical protein n=1 Tax=Arenibacter lacus TaxID=2608629 RepID=UPI00123D0063|nr:hypothetical protein [Arenibacter lacus]
MSNPFIKLLGLSLITIFISCGGGGDDSPTEPIATPPTPATPISPANEEVCLDGKSVSDTQSEVQFIWEASKHTDNYSLVITNLDSQQTTKHSSTTESIFVKLNKGEPYSWYVVSTSNKINQPAQSTTYRFYLAGEGTQSYAPFPAEVVAPEMGASVTASEGTINLRWKGSDPDNDIQGYELFLDVANPPLSSLGAVTDQNKVATVTSGNTYYWQVVTTDAEGNTSNSEIFQFKVN